MNVIGDGVANTTVNGQGHDTVFVVNSGLVTLQGLTIRGGNAQGGGGVIANAGSTVNINDARITNNSAFTGGGGLLVMSGATITMRRTTVDANCAVGAFGGGIWNQGTLFVHDSLIGGDLPPAGQTLAPGMGNDSNRAGGIRNDAGAVLNLRNTTVTGNRAHSDTAGTGGLNNVGFAFLNNVTITRNVGFGNTSGSFQGGGLQSDSTATTVVKNSIIAGNDGQNGPNDCVGNLSLDSVYNLIGDTVGCGIPPVHPTFILDQDPLLLNLNMSIGSTRAILPAENSPAVDHGFPFPPGGPAADSCEAMDQRGVLRLICDMGAVERQVLVQTTLTVNTTLDGVDILPGNSTCATASNQCSLRAAVQEANRLPGIQTIIIPAGLYQLLIPPGNEGGLDPAASGDLDLTDDVILEGADERTLVVIDGRDLSRIFDVAPGKSATIRHLTMRGGNDSGGGGVRVTSSSLTLDDVVVKENDSTSSGGGIAVGGVGSVLDVRNSVIRDNRAPFFGGNGGGIDAQFTQTTINNTSILGNQATGAGGGISGSGTVTVIESTVAGNSASGSVFANGGGISASGLNLSESTVSNNTSDAQGGGIFGSGSIVNSTISGNTSFTHGGGASTSGILSLLHVTIADNRALAGGNGLDQFGSTSELTLRNTILANPQGSECSGSPPTSNGNNIASDMSCALGASGDRQAVDAQLGPLTNNGGPTRTHLPGATSPAVNAAANVGLTKDQRGVARPQGAAPDIGSVERN
jgi:hypothetical protein